jgi:SAM-dependent methyltransferase
LTVCRSCKQPVPTICYTPAVVPIIRATNHVEEYAARAKYFGVAAMSGRGSDEITKAVARNIVSYVWPLPEGTILDVGCGDGSLLSLLSGNRIGICPSHEEVQRLKTLWPNIRFEVGTAQSLDLPDATISTVICNGVLLALETETEARKAVAEFSRVCLSGGFVFLGEIPTEPVHSEYRHDSASVWLWSLLSRGGPRSFLAGLRDVVKAATGDSPLLFYPERWFHSPRECFTNLCIGLGLRLVRDRTTPHVSSRRDYLFAKD